VAVHQYERVLTLVIECELLGKIEADAFDFRSLELG
jgi:hypothetical protein